MEQMGFLKTLGVNQIQGFLFSMPLSEDDFIEACGKEAGILTEAPSNENLSRPSTVQMLMDTVFKRFFLSFSEFTALLLTLPAPSAILAL